MQNTAVDLYTKSSIFSINQSGWHQANGSTHESFERFCSAVNYFNKVYLFFVIIIGIIGNSITILVFVRTKNQQYRRSRFFLISLAISDSVYLLVLLCYWLEEMGIYNILKRNVICQTTVYITYVASFMSSAIVLAFTVQRVISIIFPFEQSTKLKAKISFCIMLLFACVFYSFAFWGYYVEKADDGDNEPYCKAKPAYEKLIDQLNLADSVFTFCLPFTGILILNLIIIKKLRDSDNDFMLGKSTNNRLVRSMRKVPARTHHSMLANSPQVQALILNKTTTGNTIRSTTTNSTDTQCPMSVTSRKVTKMLLVISSVFFMLNLPYHSFTVYLYFQITTRPSSNYTHAEDCILTVTKQVFYTSFACNFFLYSITGTAFRAEFKRSAMKAIRCIVRPFSKTFKTRPNMNNSFVSCNH